MDKVPECGNLYICGLDVLDDLDLLTRARITHILSVLEFDYCDYSEFDKYQRILLLAEDHPLQDLYQYFQVANDFISAALAPTLPHDSSAVPSDENAVVVHCAMGQSRSATIVCAYMMYKLRITASRALGLLQTTRPMCAPNEGFMAQLAYYEQFLGIKDTATTGSETLPERGSSGLIIDAKGDAVDARRRRYMSATDATAPRDVALE